MQIPTNSPQLIFLTPVIFFNPNYCIVFSILRFEYAFSDSNMIFVYRSDC